MRALALLCGLMMCRLCFSETLGFIEQKFSAINFEKGKWSRSVHAPCYTYTANENGSVVYVLRVGTNNLVPFKASKGSAVEVCGSTAAFEEGFETERPNLGAGDPKAAR